MQSKQGAKASSLTVSLPSMALRALANINKSIGGKAKEKQIETQSVTAPPQQATN